MGGTVVPALPPTIASFKELGGTRSKVQYMPANFYSVPLCKRCTSYGNSVRLSVRPSVCPSVTRRTDLPPPDSSES